MSTKSLVGTLGNFAVQSKTQGLTSTGIFSNLYWERTSIGYATESQSSSESGPKDGTELDATHNHTLSGNTGSVGSGNAFRLLQPYITCYMWKRIS